MITPIKIVGGALIPLVVVGLVVSTFRPPAETTSAELGSLGYFEQPEPVAPARVKLVDSLGREVGFPEPTGRWTVIFFGFTACPDVCPTTLSVLNLAVQDMEAPPRVVMVSVDPERDSPERLRQYVSAFNPAFKALTGQPAEIRSLADSVGVGFIKGEMTDDGSYNVDHSAALVVLDPRGWHAGFHPSTTSAGTPAPAVRCAESGDARTGPAIAVRLVDPAFNRLPCWRLRVVLGLVLVVHRRQR
ncbi:MAG: SCO family protein [Gammaproteobacteria bacterium]|nr:SCO family protein [Gammaproteobacteria bacterium]